MNRDPGDIEGDPILREVFVRQQSWDEFCAERGYLFTEEGWEDELVSRGIADPQAALTLFRQEWRSTLDPRTNVSEVAYLQGYTSKVARTAFLEQDFAGLQTIFIDAGIATPEQLGQTIIQEGE